MARKMGVVSPLHSYAAEALGGLELGVTPLEMANVFATLADGGWRNSPIAITKVVFANGRVDEKWGRPHREKVLSEALAAEETHVLQQNVQSGTAVKSAIACPTAAKTGTTEELVDAWLDGYTPDYSTAVWMGYPNRRVPMTSVHGEPQQGGRLPSDIWHTYMSAVTQGKPCVPFPSPSESLSYKPFFGKFTTTGRGEGAGEEAPPEPPPRRHPEHAAPRGRGRGPARGEGHATPPPGAHGGPGRAPGAPPAKPHGAAPAAGKTGGAPA